MKAYYTIAIVTQSDILKCGLESVLGRIRSINSRTVIVNVDVALESIIALKPSFILIDPLAMTSVEISELRGQIKTTVLAIGWGPLPDGYMKVVDGVVGIYDSVDKIAQLLKLQLKTAETGDCELTPREQEIVAEVARGRSNKEIASEMNLAVNTVMTHRRNIAAKLHIHSAAGLTIYALMNKLVSLDEVSK